MPVGWKPCFLAPVEQHSLQPPPLHSLPLSRSFPSPHRGRRWQSMQNQQLWCHNSKFAQVQGEGTAQKPASPAPLQPFLPSAGPCAPWPWSTWTPPSRLPGRTPRSSPSLAPKASLPGFQATACYLPARNRDPHPPLDRLALSPIDPGSLLSQPSSLSLFWLLLCSPQSLCLGG